MNELVVKGSIMDVGGDPTMALMSAKIVLLCDRSISMVELDSDNKQRFVVQDKVVSDLQGKYHGQIAIVPFSDSAYLSLNGTLPRPDGSTFMLNALRFVQPIVEAGIHVVLISDGEPTDSKEEILEFAKLFAGFLDTVFVGRAGSEGDKFLRRVAEASQGDHETNEATRLLEKTLTRFLLKAGGGN